MPLAARSPGLAAAMNGYSDPLNDEQSFLKDQIAAEGALSRGWTAAGVSGQVGDLAWESNQARNAGNIPLAEKRLADMRALQQTAAAWTPEVNNLDKIHSLGDAGEFAQYGLGNMRTSLPPLAGSVAGGVLGGAAGFAVGGPGGAVLGATGGRWLGGTLAGYDMETNEAAANALSDPNIVANVSPQEIANTSRMKGVVNSGMEALVPTIVGGKILGSGVAKAGEKAIANRFGHVLKQGAISGGEEFATEGTQNVVGQVAQNSLQREDLGNIDWHDTLNEAALGGIGGHAMGTVGGVADVAHQAVRGQKSESDPLHGDKTASALDTALYAAGRAQQAGANVLQGVADRAGWKEFGQSEGFQEFMGGIPEDVVNNPDSSIYGAAEQKHIALAEHVANNLLQGAPAVDPSTGKALPNGLGDGLSDAINGAAAKFKQAQRLAVETGDNSGMSAAAETFRQTLKSVSKLNAQTTALANVGAELSGEGKSNAMKPGPSALHSASASADKQAGVTRSAVTPDQRKVTGYAFEAAGLAADQMTAQQSPSLGRAYDAARIKAVDGLYQFAQMGFKINGKTITKLPKSIIELFRDHAVTKKVDGKYVVEKEEEFVAAKLIREAATTLFQHGMIDQEALDAGLKLAANSEMKVKSDVTLKDNILGMVTRLGREKLQESGNTVNGFIDTLIAKRNVLQAKDIVEYFGGGEKANSVIEMLKQREKDKQELGGQLKGDPVTKQETKGKEAIDTERDSRPIFHGFGGKEVTNPQDATFNVDDDSHTEGMQAVHAALEEEHGMAQDIRDVGIVDAMRMMHDTLGPAPEFGRESAATTQQREAERAAVKKAEDALIVKHAKGEDVSTAEKRAAVLEKINLSRRVIARNVNRVENASDMSVEHAQKSINDGGMSVNPDDRTKGTAADGVLLLQRMHDRQAGKVNKTPYATVTGKLLEHSGFDEQANITTKKDARALIDKMLSSLAALMTSDGKFTGKVGYRETPGGAIIWLTDTFKMGKREGETELHQGADFIHTLFAQLPDSLRITKNQNAGDIIHMAGIGQEGKWTENFDIKEFTAQTMTEMKAEYAATERERDAAAWGSKEHKALGKRLFKMNEVMHVAEGANVEEPRQQTKNGQHSTGINREDNPERGPRLMDFAFDGQHGGEEIQARMSDKEQARYAKIALNAETAGYSKKMVMWLLGASDNGVPSMLASLKTKIEAVTKADAVNAKAVLEQLSKTIAYVRGNMSVKDFRTRAALDAAYDKLTGTFSDKAEGRDKETVVANLAEAAHENAKNEAKKAKAVAKEKAAVDYLNKHNMPSAEKIRAEVKRLAAENQAAGMSKDAALDKAVEDVRQRVEASREAMNAAEERKGAPLTPAERTGVVELLRKWNAEKDSTPLPKGSKEKAYEVFLGNRIEKLMQSLQGPQLPEALTNKSKPVSVDGATKLDPERHIIKHNQMQKTTGRTRFGSFSDEEISRDEYERRMAELDLLVERKQRQKDIVEVDKDGNPIEAVKEAVDDQPAAASMDDYEQMMASEEGRNNEQTPGDTAATAEQEAALRAEHAKVLGDRLTLELAKNGLVENGKPISGKALFDMIQVSMHAIDPLGVLRHEHVHALFKYLRENGSKNTLDVLTKAAGSPQMINRLKILLDGHDDAIAQLKDPEEAVAYMYQFWMMRDENGKRMLTLGPQAETLFRKLMNALTQFLAGFNEHVRTQQDAAAILQAFSEGVFAPDPGAAALQMEKHLSASLLARKQRVAIMDAINNSKIMKEAISSNWQTLRETGIPALKNLSRMFHVAEGGKVGKQQGIIDAIKQKRAAYMNKMEGAVLKLLDGRKMDDEDFKAEMALAHKHMVKGTDTDKISHEGVRKFVERYRALLAELRSYAEEADVRRWDTDVHAWVKMGTFHKNYYHASYNVDYITKNVEKFRELLKSEHMKELEAIVKEAILERDAGKHTSAEAASNVKGEITVDNVIDGIIAHITNVDGQIELNESTSALGITPYAKAVNKRTLSWLNRDKFEEFFEKDFINGATSYISQMVKRAETVRQLGNGGENVQKAFDRAYIHKLLGEDQIASIEAELAEDRKSMMEKYGLSEDRMTHHDAVMATMMQKSSAELRADMKARENRLAQLKLEEDTDELAGLMDAENYSIQQELDRRAKDGDETRVEGPGAKRKTMLSIAHSRLKGTKEEKQEKITAANAALVSAKKAVMALEGTLGREISMTARNINQAVTSYQHIRLLSTSLFRSIPDIAGFVVRGSDMQHAYSALVRGLKAVAIEWGVGTMHMDKTMKSAAYMGIVDAVSSQLNNVGERYGSMYGGNEVFRRFNEKFFRLNGMEAWNRALRVAASGAAMDFITSHMKKPGEHSIRYLTDELGLDTENKAQYFRKEDLKDEDGTVLAAKGELDIDNPAVQQAVMKWVDGCILNPNAAIRPVLASDPHYQLAYGLKTFTYAYHNVTLRRVMVEMSHGNYNPIVGLVATTVPLIIVADAMKAMLTPGDTPAWMRSLSGVIGHGFEGAPFGGVPAIFTEALPFVGKGHPMSLFGPTAQQIGDMVSLPFSADQSFANEGLGALPFGNVLRKISPAPHVEGAGNDHSGALGVLAQLDHILAPVLAATKVGGKAGLSAAHM